MDERGMITLYGFELIQDQEIPEINTQAQLWRHVKTGAELLSLRNEDENKVFGITFRTPPPDSTGLPHIMEHSVLSGSRKYPVKEPYVQLMKGSLNTFLNALTYPDKTCYPVASQNLQDFYNLIDVYLDAVFFPLLSPYTLQQEGWHYELEDADDALKFKGVVFNEMKGAYSSPDNLLQRYSQRSLFPDNAYGLDSGGDPQEIPNLTYEQFKAFHDTYYHPSNARVFFYGDDPPEERLRLTDAYLRAFEPITPPSEIRLQERFDAPKQVTQPYDASEEVEGTKKGMVTVNWMLAEASDPETTLGLDILSHILIGTPASPLRKALIDSGLGEDLTAGGLETDLRQMMFSAGLKGSAVQDAGRVEALILDTLSQLAEEGIEPEMVEAGVNTIEFSLRENNTGRFPRGLGLMLRSLATWLYDGDPLDSLRFEAPLSAIKERLADGEAYFEALIHRYLLDNTHRATVILEPDPELGARKEAAESQRLAEAKSAMSDREIRAVIENTLTLKRLQETPDPPEALATIPSLTLDDLDKETKKIPLTVVAEGGNRVLYHDLFTNGILYLDVGFNLRALPQELLPYVSLYGQALVKMGTQEEDFVRLSQRIGAKTGGIWPSTFTANIVGSDQSAAWLFLRGKSTVDQAQDLLDILGDILSSPRLDAKERFKQLVLESKARHEAGIIPGGHRTVNTRLRARFNTADWVAEQLDGMEQLFFVRRLAQEVEEDWATVQTNLERVHQALVNNYNMVFNVTVDEASWATFQSRLDSFVAKLPAATVKPATWTPDDLPPYEGLTIPAQVNYVGKGANLYALGYELDGSVAAITGYLGSTWLWERVRVQGGAYGGFGIFDHRSGVFTYLSYRDPNVLATLDNYDRTSEFLRTLELSEDELAKSIIGAVGQMDAYQLPDAKGYSSMTRYLSGDTDTLRQQRRDELLSAAVEDFKAFGRVLEQVNAQGNVVILGSRQALEDADAARDGWLNIKEAL
jgi:Zn-dependent M16 (insulinase) family peptidase